MMLRPLFRSSRSILQQLLPRRRHQYHQPSSLSSQLLCFTSSSSSSSSLHHRPRRPDLSKVLVANRGEIACRVIRTCRKWNIPTVAVYSSIDGPTALHAVMADEAYPIGIGPTPAESYLRQDELLDIAIRTNTAAIHPGYGFLSENAHFARAVTDAEAGLLFVGPPASAITAMGSKAQSKAIMEAAGVPTTPGYYSNDENDDLYQQDADYLYDKAVNEVGFPLLIKAVAGGGGKGMRLVWKESQFREALVSCRNESQAAFSDSRVLLEKYLVRPRHVEVQVMADTHGNVVHLFERDCSLQRRHQKIIEEAPASDLHPTVRQRLGEMGKRAAAAVGYVSAGTVEFLLDTESLVRNPEDPEFYFCEMNTRLQVEHPITEMITGIDLVEWQLRIAAGEPLPVTIQDEIECHGHAFEARVYAENPARNFLPATGHVWHHHIPPSPSPVAAAGINQAADIVNNAANNGIVRVDTGLQSGQDVSVYYDPMISKLIAHGATREMALATLIDALKHYQIAGVPTNIGFLIKCAQHPVFAKAGAINTGFLDDYADDVRMEEEEAMAPPPPPPALAQVAGALAVLLKLEHRIGIVAAAADNSSSSSSSSSSSKAPWSSQWGSLRMGSGGKAVRTLHLQNGHTVICTSNRDGSFDMELTTTSSGNEENTEKQSFHVSGSLDWNGEMEIVVNSTHRIKLTTILREDDEHGLLRVRMWPQQGVEDYFWEIDAVNPMLPMASGDHAGSVGGGAAGFVKSPMPGTIRRINFALGDTVEAGNVVVVMEAMKMEHACSSPISGILSEIRCKEGDVVDDGAVLFVVDDHVSEEQTEE